MQAVLGCPTLLAAIMSWASCDVGGLNQVVLSFLLSPWDVLFSVLLLTMLYLSVFVPVYFLANVIVFFVLTGT